jgi:hypothetical protein
MLATLLHYVPASAWGRADALVAGTGVFPIESEDGAALRLDDRLIARNWKGRGLQQVDWRETPTAEGMVSLKLGEARDVWEDTPSGSDEAALTIRFGRTMLAGAPLDRGIPTVKSTLGGS